MKELITHPLALPVILLIAGIVIMASAGKDLITGDDAKYTTKDGKNFSVLGFYIGLALTVVGGGWLTWILLFT